MKFTDIVLELQKTEKRIIIARCGVFMTAIGRDAILLNELFGLKLTCLKPGICKVGIPVSYVFKYLDKLEYMGYGYLMYDYDKTTKRNILKYSCEGKENTKKKNCLDCTQCEYNKNKELAGNMDIFELLKEREEKKKQEKSQKAQMRLEKDKGKINE